MKQFLYLDNDIVNSIIAQSEKGIIIQQTSEISKGEDNSSQENASLGADLKGGASFLKALNASAGIRADITTESQRADHFAKREMEEKTLHDAAFDIAFNYIQPDIKRTDEEVAEGDYVILKSRFDCVDFDYLERLFSKDGIVEWIKKQEKDSVQRNQPTQNPARQEKGAGFQRAKALAAVKETENQHKEAQSLLKVMRGLIPYNRMLYSGDGFLIPLDDKYFRIDYTNLGFKYGGEMTCVGMVTNVIREDTQPATNSMFGSVQQAANAGLRAILSSTKERICVIHPIAVYYGQ